MVFSTFIYYFLVRLTRNENGSSAERAFRDRNEHYYARSRNANDGAKKMLEKSSATGELINLHYLATTSAASRRNSPAHGGLTKTLANE